MGKGLNINYVTREGVRYDLIQNVSKIALMLLQRRRGSNLYEISLNNFCVVRSR